MFSWLWDTITRRSESFSPNSQNNDDLRINSSSTKNKKESEERLSVVTGNNISRRTSNDKQDSHSVSKYTSYKKDQLSQSGNTNPKENLVKEKLFYCPYRDCSYSAKLATTTCDHMRQEHDPTFFELLSNDDAQSAIFTTTTPSNVFISLLDQDNAIEPTERLIRMDNKNIDVDQHFYCPYQECSYQHTTKDRQADLIRHIQLNHYGDLAYQNDVHHQCYRTVDGDVLVDFSEIYHSTLPSGTILIPCDANGHVHKQYADMINNSEQTIPISITKKTNVKSSKKRRVPVVEQQPQQDGSSSGGSPLQDTPATRRSKRQKRSVWKEDEWVLY